MNIRNINLGTERTDAYRQNSVTETARTGKGASAQTAGQSSENVARDRVEISDAARAAHAEQAKSNDLLVARKALMGIPPLSEKRAADILTRVQNGYYSQPDVLRQVAEKVAADIDPAAVKND